MKKMTSLFLLLLSICLLTGCAPSPAVSGQTVQDDLQNKITVTSPKKVAALTGSLADMWLLAGGELAAVTHDAYGEGRNLPLPETALDLGGNKEPNLELLISAKVDFAILSANLKNQVALQEQLKNAGIAAAYFSVETFPDYLRVLKIFTDITQKPELYEKNGVSVEKQVGAAIERAKGKPANKVLLLRAFSTGVKAKGSDNLAGAMLKDLGCTNLADSDKGLLEDLGMEAIIQADPDFIFVTTMGESTEKAMESVKKTLVSNPAWSGLQAVKNDRYIVLPKELFHYSPNVRWGESYEQLAQILYG